MERESISDTAQEDWGQRGHTFQNLVRSDHLQLWFPGDNGGKRIAILIDYLLSISAPLQEIDH